MNRILKRCLGALTAAAIWWALPLGPVGAADRFMKPTGSDDSTGVDTTKAWLSLKHASSQLNPGDTLFVMPGTYADTTDIFRTSRPNITIKTWGDSATSGNITFKTTGDPSSADETGNNGKVIWLEAGARDFSILALEDYQITFQPDRTTMDDSTDIWIHIEEGANNFYAYRVVYLESSPPTGGRFSLNEGIRCEADSMILVQVDVRGIGDRGNTSGGASAGGAPFGGIGVGVYDNSGYSGGHQIVDGNFNDCYGAAIYIANDGSNRIATNVIHGIGGHGIYINQPHTFANSPAGMPTFRSILDYNAIDGMGFGLAAGGRKTGIVINANQTIVRRNQVWYGTGGDEADDIVGIRINRGTQNRVYNNTFAEGLLGRTVDLDCWGDSCSVKFFNNVVAFNNSNTPDCTGISSENNDFFIDGTWSELTVETNWIMSPDSLADQTGDNCCAIWDRRLGEDGLSVDLELREAFQDTDAPFNTRWRNNDLTYADPHWEGATTRPYFIDNDASDLMDKARFMTIATGGPVNNVVSIQDIYTIWPGDFLQIKGRQTAETSQILSVDLVAGTITVSATGNFNVSANDSLHLDFQSTRPDIGADERVSGGTAGGGRGRNNVDTEN